jgi:hypothetical protein
MDSVQNCISLYLIIFIAIQQCIVSLQIATSEMLSDLLVLYWPENKFEICIINLCENYTV